MGQGGYNGRNGWHAVSTLAKRRQLQAKSAEKRGKRYGRASLAVFGGRHLSVSLVFDDGLIWLRVNLWILTIPQDARSCRQLPPGFPIEMR